MKAPCTPPISERERQSGMRRRWSSEEDEVLRKYVEEHGENDWSAVMTHLYRNKKTCRDRWNLALRSTVTENPLTDDEKGRIRQLYSIFGAEWDTIQRYTVGDERFPVRRTETDIKTYMEQVLLERARGQDPNPNVVNDNDGELQAPEESVGENNEEVSSPGNHSLDLSLSLRISPSLPRNIDLNAPPPSDDAPAPD